MARSIDDSLALMETSLENIRNSLESKIPVGGGSIPSKLKLGEVANWIRKCEVKKTGTLRINQTVNYPSGFNYTDEKYVTFIHTIHGDKIGYQNTDPIVGTKTVDIELDVGTYTFYKQVNNETLGDGGYTNNFISNSESVTIKAGEVTEVDLKYTRSTGQFTIGFTAASKSNAMGNTNNYTLLEGTLSSDEIGNGVVFSSTKWYGSVESALNLKITSALIPLGDYGMFSVNRSNVNMTATVSINYGSVSRSIKRNELLNGSSTTRQIQITRTISKVTTSGSGNPIIPQYDDMSLTENPKIPVTFEVLNTEDSAEVFNDTQTNKIETMEWSDELECNIINGRPYYGNVEDYPNPLRKVYAKDYSGEIEKGKLTPAPKEEIEILNSRTI